MSSFGIASVLDRQRIAAINGGGVVIPSGGIVIGCNQIKQSGRTILAVRLMEKDDFLQYPQFIAGPEGLSANGYGAVFAGEVPVKALGSGTAGVPCGAAPGSFTLENGLPGFIWFDSETVIRDAMGRTYWAKATGNWVDDDGETTNDCYVDCVPCTDSNGSNVFSFSFRVCIPRGGRRCDPNVYAENLIPYQLGLGSAGQVRAIALGCLDDAVGTVKIWPTGEDPPQGWEEYTDLDGYFPVGWSEEDEDFGTLGDTGGTETHTHAIAGGVHSGGAYPPEERVAIVKSDEQNHIPPYRNVAFIARVAP